MGTLIRKVEPQAWFSSSQPATSGPTAMARPEVAVQAVMALAALALREDRDQQGQRGRHDHRRADAHDRAGRDDQPRPVDQAAHHRTAREDQQTATSAPAAAVLVADRAEDQHQRGVRDGVAVDDPLQVTAAQAQVRVMSGAATISDVFAMTMISRLRHSTSSAHQRRA